MFPENINSSKRKWLNIEFDEVKQNHFLPVSSINTKTKDDFLLSLKQNSDHFNKLFK